MVDGRASDRDTIYLLEADNQQHWGGAIYKIGVTSWRLGTQRLDQATKSYGVRMYPRIHARVRVDALDVEKALLEAVGVDPQFTGFDGCTEYRAIYVADLQTISDILEPVVTMRDEVERIGVAEVCT